MTLTIYKYKIPVPTQGPAVSVPMPADAKLLHVAVQGDVAHLWALVDPAAVQVQRTLFVVSTGAALHATPVHPRGVPYVGTFHMPMTPWPELVFHVFDGGEAA